MAKPIAASPTSLQRDFWRLFVARDALGNYLYSDDDVRSVLVYFYLVLYQAMGVKTPAAIQQALAREFGADMASAHQRAATVQHVIDDFFAKHPLKPQLLKAVERFMREFFLQGEAADGSRAFAAFVGQQAQVFENSRDQEGPRPHGPLALLLATKANKKTR